MDSQVKLDPFKVNIIDNNWRREVLPPGDADVPLADLPELDSGDQIPTITPKQAEQKWTDNGLSSLITLAK